jgi:hypothetical protein
MHPETFEQRMAEESVERDLPILPIRLTKESINNNAQLLSEKWDEPLEAYIRLKAMRDTIDLAMDKIKGQAKEEAMKYQGENDKCGAKFKYQEGARTFDYSSDVVWQKLKDQIKEREDFLKGLKKEMADTETGEIVQPPIVKYKSDSILITFK